MIIAAVTAAQNAVDLPAAERAFACRDERELEGMLRAAAVAYRDELGGPLEESLGAVLAAAGRMAGRAVDVTPLRTAKLINISFDQTNPEAKRWARTHSSQLITNITEETRRAIQAIVNDAFAKGLTPAAAARLIFPLVGLTEQGAGAVAALRAAIVNSPGGRVWAGKQAIRVPAVVDQAYLDRQLGKYAEKLRRARARTIARTETIAASNEGQRQLWLQAKAKGLLRGDERRKWIVHPDDQDDICDELGRAEPVGLEEPFPGGYMNPPAHPNCRCATGLVPAAEVLPVAPESIDDLLAIPNLSLMSDRQDAEAAFEKLGPSSGRLANGYARLMSSWFPEAKLQVRANQLMGAEVSARGDGITMVRSFKRNSKGLLEVHHDYFTLPKEMQGRGLAARMLAESLELYSRTGVDVVTTFANIDVGGYAWAKLGFRAANPETFASTAARAMKDLGDRISLARSIEIQNEVRRLGADAPHWLALQPEGKMILLDTSWEAIIDLTSAEGRSIAADIIQKAKAKWRL